MTAQIFNHLPLGALIALAALFTASHARADNIADCEIVLMETIEDESGQGSASVASYRPADEFIASVYTDNADALREIDGLTIRALLCSRSNVILSDTDFKLLASGVPFVLSQNFDSGDSDLMTYYFKDGEFRYSHKGSDLSAQASAELDARLTAFNTREHDLAQRESDKHAQEDKASDEESETKPIKIITLDEPTLEDEILGDK